MDPKAVLRGLELWSETPRIEVIPAGYTNRNFRVLAAGETYFARLGSDLPHHRISRRNEARCARSAARAGIAPEVVYAREGVLVTRFVEGKTLRMGERPGPDTLAALGRLLARVHRLPVPPGLGEAGLVAACRAYLELPAIRRLERQDRERIERIVEKAPALASNCLVHGDAFPENFIAGPRRMWLVDWEYAGRGHPAFDLAYAAMNLDLSEDGVRTLVAAHGGSVEPGLVRELAPVAAARDLLWCLSEIEARGITRPLRSYTRRCCERLGVREISRAGATKAAPRSRSPKATRSIRRP
jgi:aminoglycoside phosphotransferase (APT) family kinase protein